MNTFGTMDLIRASKSSRKSAVIMRVPDDIMSLIETHALKQNESSSKLMIKFDGSTGIIKIPNEGKDEIFSFNISDNTTTRDSTYCVMENENRILETLGVLQHKVNINPGASSFDRTRLKMTNQRKKNPCKAIEMADSFTESCSKKLTMKRPRTTTGTSNSTKVNVNKNTKYIPYRGFDIVSQPLRKRIIHSLALKPYRKPELLARLMQEGISELDKNKVTLILYQVATLKKELFYLDSNKWSEVEDDWKFYSSKDAATVQKKKQEQCQPNVNTASSNQPDKGNSKKRSLVDEIIANSSYPVQKKQKKNNAKVENIGAPSILQYVRNSSIKGCLSSASAPGNNTNQGPPLLSSSKRQDLSLEGYFSFDIKNPKGQVPFPSSNKKRKKKNKKKDITKNTDKKNEKKKKKRKKSKRKNRKKKEIFENSKINSIDSAKIVDAQKTNTDTVYHKIFSHVELDSQNSNAVLNNDTNKKKEKNSISSKRVLEETFEVSRQLKKKKSSMPIFPAPVSNQNSDVFGIESVNKKLQNESASKIEKTSYNEECSIKNINKTHGLSYKRVSHTENKVNKKISVNTDSVILNYGLNNLVNKFSKNTRKEISNESKCSSENFEFKDTNLSPSGKLFLQSTKKAEVNSCISEDFFIPQQSSPEEDILDALWFGDDTSDAIPEDNILDELFLSNDQIEENTNLPSIIGHNSLDTSISDQINKTSSIFLSQDCSDTMKITSPSGVPSSTVEEHIEKCKNTMIWQSNNTGSDFLLEDSSQMKKTTNSDRLPSSTVEQNSVKWVNTVSGQISKASSVLTLQDFNKTKKSNSPSEVSSSTKEEYIAKCTKNINGQMSKTRPVSFSEDSLERKSITSPSAIPSSTVDDTTLDTNTVCPKDSRLVQETKAPVLKDEQNNTPSQVFEQFTHSHAEFEKFYSSHIKSEETSKKRFFPLSVMESIELFSKLRQFLPVDSLNNYDPQVSRILELSSSQTTSKMPCDYHHNNPILQDSESIDLDAYNFKRQFCKITSFPQRKKYKEYFNSKYPAYLKLHKRITLAEKRLSRMEENLKTLKEGTQEYEVALNEIVQVYKMYFHDTQYTKFWQSRALWHDILSHIRCLILEFDNLQLTNLLM
ncbi:unnamed protein product [Larinioides sclopetarius]|uniref:OCEL domain-containing protein n=1 Tax=Larinioides sclopetarius TaxID=280406 RepID=A0AAV2AZY9_9ARAC